MIPTFDPVDSKQLRTIFGASARALSLERLFTDANETARPVFERAGFRHLARHDFEIEGVPIHNHEMELIL